MDFSGFTAHEKTRAVFAARVSLSSAIEETDATGLWL
jgi:hypothetical protein